MDDGETCCDERERIETGIIDEEEFRRHGLLDERVDNGDEKSSFL